MNYDNDLNPLLENCTSEELNPIVNILTSTKTCSLQLKMYCSNSESDHTKYVDIICDEIRSFGSNTIKNFTAGSRLYIDIVKDIASKIGVTYTDEDNITNIEKNILEKVFMDNWNAMSEKEKIMVVSSYRGVSAADVVQGGIEALDNVDNAVTMFSNMVISSATNDKFSNIPFLNDASVELLKGLVMPPHLAVGVSSAVYVTGPAYRVIRPIVIYIASLRTKKQCIQVNSITNTKKDDDNKLKVNDTIKDAALKIKGSFLSFRGKLKD